MKNTLKRILFISVTFALVSTLSSCGEKTGNSSLSDALNPNGNSSVSTAAIPKAVKKDLGNSLLVDAAIIAPSSLPKEAGIIPTDTKSFEKKETVIRTLLPAQSQMKTNREKSKDRFGRDVEFDHYEAANGSNALGWGSGTLNFSSELGFDIEDALPDDRSSLQKLYPEKELSFMKCSDARKKAEDLLTLLGVKTSKEVEVCSLDYKAMKQGQIESEKKAEKDNVPVSKRRKIRNWSEKDNCYYFDFQQEFNGVPVTRQILRISDTANGVAMGPTIRVIYGAQGYVSATVYNVYEPCGEGTGKKVPLTLGQALTVMKNRYQDIILIHPVTITKIEFSYVPLIQVKQKDYLLTPCWSFQTSQYSDEIKRDIQKNVVINALTGEEMK